MPGREVGQSRVPGAGLQRAPSWPGQNGRSKVGDIARPTSSHPHSLLGPRSLLPNLFTEHAMAASTHAALRRAQAAAGRPARASPAPEAPMTPTSPQDHLPHGQSSEAAAVPIKCREQFLTQASGPRSQHPHRPQAFTRETRSPCGAHPDRDLVGSVHPFPHQAGGKPPSAFRRSSTSPQNCSGGTPAAQWDPEW